MGCRYDLQSTLFLGVHMKQALVLKDLHVDAAPSQTYVKIVDLYRTQLRNPYKTNENSRIDFQKCI